MSQTKRRLVLGSVLFLAIGAAGCASKSLSEPYPAYYSNWDRVTPDMREELEAARSEMSASNGEKAPILRFARVSGRLAQQEAQTWLGLTSLVVPVGDTNRQARIGRARQRVVESSTHALTLFNEYTYRGGHLELEDQLVTIWLLLLRGDEQEALLLQQELIASPNLPGDIRQRLEQLKWDPALFPDPPTDSLIPSPTAQSEKPQSRPAESAPVNPSRETLP